MDPILRKALWFGSVVAVGATVILYFLFKAIVTNKTGFETKTLWDWMELLIIPLVLAGGAFFLQSSERDVERQVAAKRAELEREIATDRQQEAALQAYLDRMSELLLEKELRMSQNEEVRNVARLRTLTVLRGLDEARKGIVLLFLYESGLIFGEPIIDLTGADLSGAKLGEANLSKANLNRVNFSGASLHSSNLSGANLSGANLSKVNLNMADLSGADLSEAKIVRASIIGADLS